MHKNWLLWIRGEFRLYMCVFCELILKKPDLYASELIFSFRFSNDILFFVTCEWSFCHLLSEINWCYSTDSENKLRSTDTFCIIFIVPACFFSYHIFTCVTFSISIRDSRRFLHLTSIFCHHFRWVRLLVGTLTLSGGYFWNISLQVLDFYSTLFCVILTYTSSLL